MAFAEELDKASRALARFVSSLDEAQGAGGGGRGRGGSLGGGLIGGLSGGRGFLAAGGPAGLALAGAGALYGAAEDAARFSTPAARAFSVTGSSASLAVGVSNSVLDAVQGNAFGGLLLGATGVSAARDTASRAGARTVGVTEQLARVGINVPDETRQRLFDTALQQERRVTQERQRVDDLAGSADAIDRARPAGAGEGFDSVVSAIRSLENTVKSLSGGGR